MGRIDGWTDDRVDYCICLLAMAARLARDIDSDLWEKIKRFLDEEA